MSDKKVTTPPKKGRGGGFGYSPAEKSENFAKTIGRLIKKMFDNTYDRIRIAIVVIFLIISAALAAYAPSALGKATNELFNGLISKQISRTVECSLPLGVDLNTFKAQVDDQNGHLDVNKMLEMMKKQASQANSSTTANPSQFIQPRAASVETTAINATLKPSYCNEDASKTKDEFDGASNVDSIKDMLSGMSITLGAGVDFNKVLMLLMFVVLIYIGGFLSRWIAGWLSIRVIGNLTKRLNEEVERKLWRLPLKYYDKHSRGDMMSRVTNDIDNVRMALTQTGGDFVYMVLMVIGVVGMMFYTSWILALIAIITVPLMFGVIGLIMKLSQPQFKKQWAKTGSLNSHIEESFSGHMLVKAFGKKDEFQKKFEDENNSLAESTFKAQFLSQLMMPIMTFFTNINYVIIALVGGIRILHGQLTLGDLQAFIQYSRQYSQPLGQIAGMMNQLQSGAASAERIFELLDAQEMEDDSTKLSEFKNIKGAIEFEKVSFAYDEKVKLIENMNLKVKPGQTVAIVGPTGAGKTTLVNLIMRFYEVNKGAIKLDGVDVREIQRQVLRLNIGMVLQDTWLFNGTVEENLKYGAREDVPITDEEFEKACQVTYVDHFVKSLPKGYQTILNDDDTAISVGEKQLLTIARAFIANPEILILDEATSSVDTRTEVLIQKAMNALKKNRTSFIIAHRLSTIRDADIIIVMENGSIVEQGNHNELINKKDGRYAALYQSQFENEPEEEV